MNVEGQNLLRPPYDFKGIEIQLSFIQTAFFQLIL